MIIKILCVGKTKKKWLVDGENEYLKKIGKYARVSFEIVEQESTGDKNKIIEIESGKIERLLKSDFYNVLLDVSGKIVSSEEFADILTFGEVKGKICFIIGGSFGVSENVKKLVDARVSMSKMTLVHEMIRVFLLEQIFRGFEINRGGQYHK